MKFRPLSPAPHSRRGFTLVEVLAAVAVLSIMVVALAQILAVVSTTWQQGQGRVNNFTKSRSVLDMIAADISRGVFRPDVYNFPSLTGSGNIADAYAFFTRIPGPGSASGNRDISLVTYQLNLSGTIPNKTKLQAGDLLRMVEPVPWTQGLIPTMNFQHRFNPAPPSQLYPRNDVLCGGILDFEILFIRADGSAIRATDYIAPPDYVPPIGYDPVTATSNPVVRMVIGVATVDDQTLLKLGDAGLARIYTILHGNVEDVYPKPTKTNPSFGSLTDSSLKRIWDNAIPGILNGSPPVPKNMAIGMKTFERTVPCTPFN